MSPSLITKLHCPAADMVEMRDHQGKAGTGTGWQDLIYVLPVLKELFN